jgi:hypothetical protein
MKCLVPDDLQMFRQAYGLFLISDEELSEKIIEQHREVINLIQMTHTEISFKMMFPHLYQNRVFVEPTNDMFLFDEELAATAHPAQPPVPVQNPPHPPQPQPPPSHHHESPVFIPPHLLNDTIQFSPPVFPNSYYLGAASV